MFKTLKLYLVSKNKKKKMGNKSKNELKVTENKK